MLRPAGLGAEIFAEALPAFEGAVEALRQGVIPGAIERNREYVGDALHLAPGVDGALADLGFDAQTSGGLLIAVPAERLKLLRQSLARRGAGHFVIGRILPGAAGQIFLSPARKNAARTSKTNPAIRQQKTDSMKTPAKNSPPRSDACCAGAIPGETASGSVAETQKAFGALMRAAQAPGALDAKTKELIMFSLVVCSRCQPCFDAHFRKALEIGVPRAELDEAAWLAIAMGGAPVKMFYQENLERIQS
jgi:AhpD family alkylhydroperoxidase